MSAVVGPADPPVDETVALAVAESASAADGSGGRAPSSPGNGTGRPGDVKGSSTTAQMRRFIKSRPWVPMHELRRRFAIEGGEDDVAPVDLEGRRIFVGLPERESRQLGELLRSGEIGFELSLDPVTPVVIGVYPMRPVVRT